MLAMNEKKRSFDQQLMTKTTEVPREALEVMVAKLRARKGLRWQGAKLTREAYINAVWLWMEELGPEVVERGIASHLRRLEELVGKDSPAPFAEAHPVEEPRRPRKKRNG